MFLMANQLEKVRLILVDYGNRAFFIIAFFHEQCRYLHIGVPIYRPPKMTSTHFYQLITDSATTVPQSTFEGKT